MLTDRFLQLLPGIINSRTTPAELASKSCRLNHGPKGPPTDLPGQRSRAQQAIAAGPQPTLSYSNDNQHFPLHSVPGTEPREYTTSSHEEESQRNVAPHNEDYTLPPLGSGIQSPDPSGLPTRSSGPTSSSDDVHEPVENAGEPQHILQPVSRRRARRPAENGEPRRRGRLPKEATDLLKKWVEEHIASPYPTEEEKLRLEGETRLERCQVC